VQGPGRAQLAHRTPGPAAQVDLRPLPTQQRPTAYVAGGRGRRCPNCPGTHERLSLLRVRRYTTRGWPLTQTRGYAFTASRSAWASCTTLAARCPGTSS
jgi:hypothetical protein